LAISKILSLLYPARNLQHRSYRISNRTVNMSLSYLGKYKISKIASKLWCI